MDTTQRTSRLAILALALSIITAFSIPVLLLSFLLLNADPQLARSLSSLYTLAVIAPGFLIPVALSAGIIALIRIRRNKPRLKGSSFAWVAVFISTASMLCAFPGVILAFQLFISMF